MTLLAHARKTCRYIEQQSGFAAPRLPAYDELLVMARAFRQEVGNGHDESRERLGDTGQICPDDEVVAHFAAHQALSPSAARRELVRLLADAKQVGANQRANQSEWRVRDAGGRSGKRGRIGMDMYATVEHDGELLLVVGIRINPHAEVA